MKHQVSGRLMALVGVAALTFSACSGGSGASASAKPSGSAAAGGTTVGYLPKDIVNKYFAAAKTIDAAAARPASLACSRTYRCHPG